MISSPRLNSSAVGSTAATNKVRVFTVPVSAGFGPVEAVFNSYTQRHPDVEWYFANVYDERDGVTPLNWWSN